MEDFKSNWYLIVQSLNTTFEASSTLGLESKLIELLLDWNMNSSSSTMKLVLKSFKPSKNAIECNFALKYLISPIPVLVNWGHLLVHD